ncbi:MAG: mechanosensitive ion channel family protein [Acidobacteria bacterium]|nr:mechanosensitive ion channel family protein [Acidobacteriota bacterium]
MFRDLQERVSARRRALAWVLLVLLGAAALTFAPRFQDQQGTHRAILTLLAAGGAFLVLKSLTWLLVDPLMSRRETDTPGFGRDLLVVVLYFLAAGWVMRYGLGISVGQILGTGALAAAVVGLSLQEVLGNLFAGISLHVDPAFRVGDWIEISGNVRGGPGRESFVGQVEAMTWRTVRLRTENGDTDIFPNRVLTQAVVTNLYAPSGLHRRTTRVVVEPHPDLHLALQKLTLALAGVPHLPGHQPSVVVCASDLGGAVLEARVWALGFRHGRAAVFHATRLLTSVLPREGFSLLGPHGPTTPHEPLPEPTDAMMTDLVRRLQLPPHWGKDLKPHLRLRNLAPGEGVIREGDPGESLFAVISGLLHVVKAAERTEPYTGLFWDIVAVLGPGEWLGEASLLTGAPRNATVVTATEVLLAEIPKAGFEASLRREPELLERLADLMEARSRPAEQPSETRRDAARALWLKQIRAWFALGG